MTERSLKEKRAAATGGISHCNDTSPEESSSITAAGKVVDHEQNLAQVMRSVDRTLGLLHHLYLTVSSFNASSPLLHRLAGVLDNMTKLVRQGSIQVPMEVINLIDDGRNPDELTRNVLNGCIAKNQVAKGKTDAFKSLRMHLLEELEQVFPDAVEAYREIDKPDAVEAYREIRAASAAEMK